MVKGGSASEPFRFIYFDMHSVKQSVDCTGTGGYEFIKLINNFLFLKKVGSPSEYHICQFDPSQVANSVQSFRTKRIKIPTTLENNMVGILPYSVK